MTATAPRPLSSIAEARRELGPKMLRGIDLPGVSVYEFAAYEADHMVAPPRDHHVITTCLENSASVRQQRGGQTVSGPARTGSSIVMPAGNESTWHGRIPGHLRIALPPAALAEAAAEVPGVRRPDSPILRNEFRAADPFIAQVTGLLRAELELAPHPGQDLVIEALSAALAAHLLRAYGAGADPHAVRAARRAPRAAVGRALEYIAAHPARPIALEELAAVAGLSKFHFARCFRTEVGITPAQYIEMTRIDQAKLLLGEGRLSIAEIAHAVGFADQSHFARRFRLHTGCAPSAYLPTTARTV